MSDRLKNQSCRPSPVVWGKHRSKRSTTLGSGFLGFSHPILIFFPQLVIPKNHTKHENLEKVIQLVFLDSFKIFLLSLWSSCQKLTMQRFLCQNVALWEFTSRLLFCCRLCCCLGIHHSLPLNLANVRPQMGFAPVMTLTDVFPPQQEKAHNFGFEVY